MDYSRAVALAQRLIEKNGRATKLQVMSGVAADVDKPWEGAGTPTVLTEYDRKGVFLPHAGLEDLGRYLVDAELLKSCTQVVMIAGGPDDLSACHRFDDGGKKWRIVWVRELKPADITVLYVFGVSE